MSPSRLRFLWPALCILLALALVGSVVYSREKIRSARAQARKKPARIQRALDKRDTSYFRSLANMRNYQVKLPLTPGDGARLAAYDRIEYNHYLMQARREGPTTFETRNPAFTQRRTVTLASTMSVDLPEPFRHYQYELLNKSDRALPVPILFQNDRWDSAAALVEQAGFKRIPDEIERAIAIWRYVCGHHAFGDPPTEGSEEHDVLKFLAIYGYGYCDDTARAVAALAELSGLRGRIWALEGHIVSEIEAGGRWRMLDADRMAYFHRAGTPNDILGVEELSADRAAFQHSVFFAGTGEYSPKFIDCFLTKENNKLDDGGSSTHVIQPVLRPSERMTMTNFNWGRYFLGRYPAPPPLFHNGSFTYILQPRDLIPGAGKIEVTPIDGGHRLRNPGAETATAALDFAYPFPIVGGLIRAAVKVNGLAGVRLEDVEHDRITYANLTGGLNLSLDHFISVLASSPTYHYTLTFSLEAGSEIELRNFTAISDFQFAPLALLKLQTGANELRAHFAEGCDPTAFELSIDTK